MTHECRVDPHTAPEYSVLSTRYSVRKFPNVTVQMRTSANKTTQARFDTFIGSDIVRWHRASGEV